METKHKGGRAKEKEEEGGKKKAKEKESCWCCR